MTTPVAHSVCESAGKFLRDITTPPTSRPSPARKPMATRNSGGTRLLSNEYLTKNATPRNSAKPPTHAKPLTPMNCSQLIFGLGGGGGAKMRACFDGAVVIEIGGGGTTGGSCGAMAGCGATAGGGRTTGDGVMIFGCGAGAGAGLTGFGSSFSRFSRNISDSRAMSRSESSSMRFPARMARTISQIASAIGTPRVARTTNMMPGSIILF